jgi:Flp pilus assembly protein TadB
MTARPPRLALALLERFVPANDELVGDLVEEFERRPSRRWFWRQTLAAMFFSARQPARDVRPLQLVDEHRRPPAPGAIGLARARAAASTGINITASPQPGVSGLSLVLFGALITAVAPRLWWIVLLVIASGIVLGVLRVIRQRRRDRHTSVASQANVLIGGDAERGAPASGHVRGA